MIALTLSLAVYINAHTNTNTEMHAHTHTHTHTSGGRRLICQIYYTGIVHFISLQSSALSASFTNRLHVPVLINIIQNFSHSTPQHTHTHAPQKPP